MATHCPTHSTSYITENGHSGRHVIILAWMYAEMVKEMDSENEIGVNKEVKVRSAVEASVEIGGKDGSRRRQE